jgi:hypothetical protein
VKTTVSVALLLIGCVDTSPDRVKLTASVTDVGLTVAQSSLVTTLGGSFVLHVDLGDLAQGDTTIQDPPTFQLVTAQNRSELVVLDALVQDSSFPLKVSPGNKLALSYKLNDQQSLPSDGITSICVGDVQIAGTLRDTASGEPTAFESPAVKASGCP